MAAVCLENGDVQNLNVYLSVRARVKNVERSSDAVCLRNIRPQRHMGDFEV
jgi:hypothetical protein